MGDADGPPRLPALRRAGRGLGFGGHCRHRPQRRPLRGDPPQHADRQAAGRCLENPTDEEKDALAAVDHYQKVDSGYFKQQSTRPQTVGYGLVDSPAAQLAWIVEKFWSWTDCDGHPENALTRDEMLDDVTLYWVTGNGRIVGAAVLGEPRRPSAPVRRVELPTGVASFPKELSRPPRAWCEGNYNITHWTKMPRGGHFAAFEQPELFVEDVRKFFATLR